MSDNILELFCDIDDFCQIFSPNWERQLLTNGERKRKRPHRLGLSEIMTLVVLFHQSHYRDFKAFYLLQVRRHLIREFSNALSYSRLVHVLPSVLVLMCVYLTSRRGQQTGISFIDAASIVVCHNWRIRSHKVFKQAATRGKTSTGWFFGFKLHLVINDQGKLLAFQVTPGHDELDNSAKWILCFFNVNRPFGGVYLPGSFYTNVLAEITYS